MTTSDVLSKLNQQLSALSSPGESFQPRVELQRRLPDGSTIPATEKDIETSDFETKIQQAATYVSLLEDPADRIEWAKEQRQVGNAYFSHGDYKAAMDIYLTCLVVKDTSDDFIQDVFLPVLNNLAQCTLQLSMYKKTIRFCTIALEDPNVVSGSDQHKKKYPLETAKLHYKRGKARRLSGEYLEGRKDLTMALKLLDVVENDDTSIYVQAVRKEFRHLEASEKEARKNRQRAKKAMQAVLSIGKKDEAKATQISNPSKHQTETAEGEGYYYADNMPRKFSSIRARKMPKEDISQNETEKTTEQLSYRQYYWLLVARVAETLLLWLGDEETLRKTREDEQNKND